MPPRVPVDDVDPFALDVLEQPYPMHQQLRDAGPVVRLSAYDVWGLARFDEVHAALTDPETFCSGAGVGLSDFRREKPWRAPSLLLEADPPDHTRARHAITKVLTPGVVRELRQTLAREADALVDRLVEQRSFDAMTDLARAFPAKVFPDAVGLPADGRENLLRYGSIVFNVFGPRNELFERATADSGPVREWIERHCARDALAPGGLGHRIHDAAAAEGYDADDAGMLVRSFLTAGVDTTVNGLGNALHAFSRHPQQWRALHEEPGLARAAFEEAIRYESPVQTFFRTTTRDVDLGGVTIPRGEKVLMFLGSANRDPRRWSDPERFDITRRASGHVGFGSGIHACVGQMLARLEGEVVLGALARRVERIEPAGAPVLELNNTLRGFAHLPVTVEAA